MNTESNISVSLSSAELIGQTKQDSSAAVAATVYGEKVTTVDENKSDH